MTAAATESAPGAVIDTAAMLDRFEGDIELAREVVELFLEDCPRRLAAVRAALAHGDSGALEFAAHSIKGSVSNFGAAAAVVAALRLEIIGRTGDLSHATEACAALEQEIARLTPVLLDETGSSRSDTDDQPTHHPDHTSAKEIA